jgi:DNA polymerase elongation subunit (family B)
MDEREAIVYGKGSTEGIVAVEDNGGEVIRYHRDPDSGEAYTTTAPFYPTVWIGKDEVVEDIRKDTRSFRSAHKLDGDLPIDNLLILDDMDGFFKVYRDLKMRAGPDEYLPEWSYTQTDDAQMYMMQSGETSFNGLDFDDLHRLTFDIETITTGGGMPDAYRRGDEVIIIGLKTNRGYEAVLHTGERTDHPLWACDTEADMLRTFVGIIQDLDPDVLEGHNVHDFDLDYLRKRCDLLGIPFEIGRGETEPRHYETMKRVAQRYLEYECHDVPGRHVIDTMFQAADWNVYARELDSFGLKEVAKTLGIAAPERTYVDRSEMKRLWNEERDRLLDYALDDVIETKRLSEELSAAKFEMAKIVPVEYGTLNRCGTGRIIESMMVREYLRQGHSLPIGGEKQSYEGAYTACFRQGVYGVDEGTRIMNYDFASLYPYTQMGFECYPESDRLDVMKTMLETLTELRVQHKEEMRSLPDDNPRKFKLDAQQDSEKVLINSFYGTEGDENFIFNDMDQAAEIVLQGQEALKRLMYIIDRAGHTIIEADTDGVWALNDGHGPAGQELADVATEHTADHLDVDLDADLPGMAMYRAKNYAKQSPDGSVSFKGSAMTSSAFEKFGREFIQRGYRHMLDGKIQELHDLYVEYVDRICDRDIPVEKLAKRETLKEPYDEYREAVDSDESGRNAAARYELAHEYDFIDEQVGSTVQYYNAGDLTSSSVYEVAKPVELYDDDENVKYYVRKRMQSFASKFEPFFSEEDYERMFPRPDRGEVRVDRNDVGDVMLVRRQIEQPELRQEKMKP